MVAYQTIFEIALYISEGLIVYYYAKSLFEQKYNTGITIFFISLTYSFLFLIYKLDNGILNLIFSLAFVILILVFLFNCDFKTSIFHSFLLVIIMLSCELVFMFFISSILKQDFNSYESDFNIRLLNTVTSKFLYYVLCFVLVKIFSKDKSISRRNSIFWILFLMPLASIIVLFAFRYVELEVDLSDSMKLLCSISSIFLLFTNIIVFFIYELSTRNVAELYKLQAIKQKEEIDKTYFEVIEQNNKDLKIFTHDIKNHLEQLSNLSDNSEIREYISKLYGTVNKYNKIALSGNKTLDIIINKYNSICSGKNIDISFEVKTANLSDLDNTDLATIMNNLLDNAVEAAEQCEKKKIEVSIFAKPEFEVIKIENSCERSPSISNKKLLTSKKDKDLHGLGIESIIRTVKKYNGIFDWIYSDKNKIFETTVAIPKNR